MTTFGQMLSGIAKESYRAWVYLPAERDWTLSSQCAALESEEVPPDLEDEPDAGVPAFAKQNGLVQVLPVAALQDVVSNLQAQKPNASLQDFFDAFMFYYKHDAFIDLTNA